MSCVINEVIPASSNPITVLTNVTPDEETVFTLSDSSVAVLSVPADFDVDGKPFELVVAGKKHTTSTSTTWQMRLMLGDSATLGNNTSVDIFASTSGTLDSSFLFVGSCLWDSGSQKLTMAITTIVGTIVTRSDLSVSSVANQSDLKFVLFGKFSSTGFSSSDSITITEFKVQTI